MIKKVKAALASLVAVSALAFAGSTTAQDVGFYAGIALGQAKTNLDCEGTTSCDEKDSSWRIFGGYQFNRNFALEVGYINFGEATATTPPFGGIPAARVTFEGTAFELVGVGMLPLADRFSILGKLGLYRSDIDIDIAFTGFPTVSDSDDNVGLTFGIGAGFDVTRNIGIRAEWQRYMEVSVADFGEADIDVISLSVLFKF